MKICMAHILTSSLSLRTSESSVCCCCCCTSGFICKGEQFTAPNLHPPLLFSFHFHTPAAAAPAAAAVVESDQPGEHGNHRSSLIILLGPQIAISVSPSSLQVNSTNPSSHFPCRGWCWGISKCAHHRSPVSYLSNWAQPLLWKPRLSYLCPLIFLSQWTHHVFKTVFPPVHLHMSPVS